MTALRRGDVVHDTALAVRRSGRDVNDSKGLPASSALRAMIVLQNTLEQKRGSMCAVNFSVAIAKQVFSVYEVPSTGCALSRRDLRREAFALWLAQVPAGTVVAMEACSGAHHWVRRCHEHGLQPRLMAAQFVTPFRKSQTPKNDRNDAEVIATAARQGNTRFVPVESVDQQARLAWHRVREGYKTESLAISNRLRGLLAEFGVVVANSDLALRRVLADLAAMHSLPHEFKEVLVELDMHWQGVRTRMQDCDRRMGVSDPDGENLTNHSDVNKVIRLIPDHRRTR